MKRLAMILAASWLASSPAAKAGELDSDFVGKSGRGVHLAAPEKSPGSSEMDAESPDQACHRRWRRGYYGFSAYGFGYPGFGFGYYGRGYGFGYGRGRW